MNLGDSLDHGSTDYTRGTSHQTSEHIRDSALAEIEPGRHNKMRDM